MEEESMFVHLKKKHCLNKLLTVKGAKRLTLPALREQVPRDTNIVIQNATMKKLIGYKHSTNTFDLALAERLQVGGFHFGSKDLSYRIIFTFILTTHHWVKSQLWLGFPCSSLFLISCFTIIQS